jgi:hypothetical protein
MTRLPAFNRTAAAALLALAALAGSGPALAQPRGDANRGLDGPRPEAQPPRAEERRGGERREDRREDRRVEDRRVEDRRGDAGRPAIEAPRRGPAPVVAVDSRHWHDAAHGLNRDYPRPGWVVRQPPPRSSVVYWGGVNYHFWDGVWYSPGSRGYVVVRPPYGVVIADRPAFYSLLTIAGIGYLYANGVYYREYPSGGYEVVPPPVDGSTGSALTVTTVPQGEPKPYVYPSRGQSAERQATDEYECHAWAVAQTGFDPTAAATGQRTSTEPAQRDNYQRARIACLEGRGYTVR